MQKLSEIEQKQYARQINLAEIGISGQQKLKNAAVLVVGAGGLGCPVLQFIAAAGVGKIGIADGDLITISNIHRQILYAYDDIGKPKAETAKLKICAINPNLICTYFNEFITLNNAQNIINQFDIIVDCTDNFETRYVLNDCCQTFNKPLFYASIYKFEGQVTVFDFKHNHSLRSLFPQKPDQETIPTCNIHGVLNTHSGIIALFQANEVLKFILEIGNSLIGKVLNFNTLTLENHIFSYSNFVPNQNIVKYIEKQDFKEILLTNQDFELIDVREKQGFLQNNIGGKNIPFSEFESNISIINTSKPIYFICDTGSKSKIVAEKFATYHSETEVFSVVGGIENL